MNKYLEKIASKGRGLHRLVVATGHSKEEKVLETMDSAKDLYGHYQKLNSKPRKTKKGHYA
jgi:hypothetical protein